MHTQQNSHLHFLQVMWLELVSICGSERTETPHLQPPDFSMVDWHLLHSFVFAWSQLAVSESSAHFLSHALTILQSTG